LLSYVVGFSLNILFVHEVDWENKVVFDFHSLSELLASFGHNIFVIDFEGFKRGKRLDNIFTVKTEIKEFTGRSRQDISLTVIRPPMIKAPFLDRASAFVSNYLSIDKVLKDKKIDAIVLYSVPTNGYQVIKLAQRFNIPVVFRSIDALYHLVPSRFFSAPTLSLETWVYNRCDRIMALSPKLSEYVLRLGKGGNKKVELLLFGVDLNKFNPNIDCSDLRKSLGLAKDDLVVLFVGTLFDFSGLDLYLEQFPKVVAQLPNVKLLIVGGGALLERLKKRAKELNIEKNVVFTGFQPFGLMPLFINLADVCINPFRLNATTRDIIPGKVLQYLACAKPVVATPLPGMITQIRNVEHGVVYSQIEDFATSTVRLLKDHVQRKKIGYNGLLYATLNHDEVALARKLEKTLICEVEKKKNARSKVT
jgi:glycosyltransferase involved in cell wall biosynthesis